MNINCGDETNHSRPQLVHTRGPYDLSWDKSSKGPNRVSERAGPLPANGPNPRIMQQIKDEMDIDHVSFLGLFKERTVAADVPTPRVLAGAP